MNALTDKLAIMRDNMIDAARREVERLRAAIEAKTVRAAATPAPAQPILHAETPPSAKAAPARPSAEIIPLSNFQAMCAAGVYIPDVARRHSIDHEFAPSPATAGWRASVERKPQQFSPDTVDVTNGDAVSRAYEAQQVRISTEQNRK